MAIVGILIPNKVKKIGGFAFAYCPRLFFVEFLGEECLIDESCFIRFANLALVSFPNAIKLSICKNTFSAVSDEFPLFPKARVIINSQQIFYRF